MKKLFRPTSIIVAAILFIFTVVPFVPGLQPEAVEAQKILRVQPADGIDAVWLRAQRVFYNLLPQPALASSIPDYLTDGTADDVQIQEAIDALTVGRTWYQTVKLMGDFTFASSVILADYTTLDISDANIDLVYIDYNGTNARITNGEKITSGNLFRNTQWQVIVGGGLVSKQTVAGTSNQSAVSVDSYTENATTVVSLSSDTSMLEVGDLVEFSAAADANLKITPLRITEIDPNVSFTVILPTGLTTTATAACTAQPVTRGDLTGNTGAVADKWTKYPSTTLSWRELWSDNVKKGSTYSLAIKKTAGTDQYLYETVLPSELEKYKGKTVVVGFWVYHKVKSGSGGVRVNINDGVIQKSSEFTGTGWMWVEGTFTVRTAATLFAPGLIFTGSADDVYYVSHPMFAFGSLLSQDNYSQPQNEYLILYAGVTPDSWYNASITFPAGSPYQFVFDLYAESDARIAPTVKRIDLLLEGINNGAVVVGSGTTRCMAFRDSNASPIRYGILLPQYVQNVKSYMGGSIYLDGNGKAIAYSSIASVAWTNVSMDISGILLD